MAGLEVLSFDKVKIGGSSFLVTGGEEEVARRNKEDLLGGLAEQYGLKERKNERNARTVDIGWKACWRRRPARTD